MDIKTVFALHQNSDNNLDAFTVRGYGQDAAVAISQRFPTHSVKKILRGFIINDKFVKADLSSSWIKPQNKR